jgi:hypothetical protein
VGARGSAIRALAKSTPEIYPVETAPAGIESDGLILQLSQKKIGPKHLIAFAQRRSRFALSSSEETDGESPVGVDQMAGSLKLDYGMLIAVDRFATGATAHNLRGLAHAYVLACESGEAGRAEEHRIRLLRELGRCSGMRETHTGAHTRLC